VFTTPGPVTEQKTQTRRGKRGYMFGIKAPSPIPSCSLRASGNNIWCVFIFLTQWDYHWFQPKYCNTFLLTPMCKVQAVLGPRAGRAGHRISHVCKIPPTLFTALTSARFLDSWKISVSDQSSMDK